MVPSLALVFAGLFLSAGCAGEGEGEGEREGERKSEGGGALLSQGLVYRVESAAAPFYLAGSFHLLREEDYPLPPQYEAAYRATARVVVEVRKSEDPDAGGRMFLEAGTLPAGESLGDYVPQESLGRLDRVLVDLGLSPSATSRFRPWMVAAMVAVSQYNKLGARAELGLDRHFEARADTDGKRVSALESVAEQVAAFEKMSGEESVQMLEQTIATAGSLGDNAAALLRAWRSGDEEALAGLIFQDLEEYRGFFEALVFERNREWAESVGELIGAGESAMVIVGAAHLVGDGSLVDLLRETGHSVVPLGVGTPEGAPAPAPVPKPKPGPGPVPAR